jgi:hypothetical protein
MANNLNPDQLARVLKTTPPVTETPSVKQLYDESLDSLIEGMFGRRWDRDEHFPPIATDIWSLLFNCGALGEEPSIDDVPLLISIAQTTTSESLRHRALAALRNHLSDVSGVDCSLKPRVSEILTRLNEQYNHA